MCKYEFVIQNVLKRKKYAIHESTALLGRNTLEHIQKLEILRK